MDKENLIGQSAESASEAFQKNVKSGAFLGFYYKHQKVESVLRFDVIREEENQEGSNGEYAIRLQPTFGQTVGNSLRRILLGSMEGLGIVAISIKGCKHIFDGIQGIKENTIELLLNLRKVVFRTSNSFDELTVFQAKINKSGQGIVRGEDIKCSEGLEIVNDQIPIFTLDANASIEINLIVVNGHGYKKSSEHEFLPAHPQGFISVDTFFSPVLNCKYSVETYTGGSSFYDLLNLDITTNGFISAREALMKSLSLLKQCTESVLKIMDGTESIPAPSPEKIEEEVEDDSLLQTDVMEIQGLKVRIKNILAQNNIRTLEELLLLRPEEVKSLDGLGPTSYEGLVEFLTSHGLVLGAKKIVRRKI